MEQHLMIFGLINIILICLILLSLFIKTRWSEIFRRTTSPYAGVVIASITASLVVRFLISPAQALRELANPLTYIYASSFPLAVTLFSPLSIFQYIVISASMIISLLGKRPLLSLALSFIFSVFIHIFILALILAMIYGA